MQGIKRDTDIKSRLWTQWGKERVEQTEKVTWKYIHYHKRNSQPAGICYMTQGAHTSALWQSKGVGGVGRREVGSRGRGHVYLWLMHVDVWQKPTQYCKAIILQLNKKKKNKKNQKILQSLDPTPGDSGLTALRQRLGACVLKCSFNDWPSGLYHSWCPLIVTTGAHFYWRLRKDNSCKG